MSRKRALYNKLKYARIVIVISINIILQCKIAACAKYFQFRLQPKLMLDKELGFRGGDSFYCMNFCWEKPHTSLCPLHFYTNPLVEDFTRKS